MCEWPCLFNTCLGSEGWVTSSSSHFEGAGTQTKENRTLGHLGERCDRLLWPQFNLNIQATSQRAIHDFIDHAVLCEPRTLWLTSRLRKFLQAYLCVKMHGRNVYGCSHADLLNQGGAVSAGRVFASQHGSPSCQFKEWRVESQVVSCLSDNPGCCVCVCRDLC